MSELKEQIKELTLLLMYATAFKQTGRYESDYWQAWKGYDFDAMNALNDEDLIYDEKHKNKSVVITDTGIEKAKQLAEKYGIDISGLNR